MYYMCVYIYYIQFYFLLKTQKWTYICKCDMAKVLSFRISQSFLQKAHSKCVSLTISSFRHFKVEGKLKDTCEVIWIHLDFYDFFLQSFTLVLTNLRAIHPPPPSFFTAFNLVFIVTATLFLCTYLISLHDI